MKDMELVLRLRADGKGFVGEVKQSGQAVQQLGNQGQKAGVQLEGTERSIQSINRRLPSFINGFNLSAAAVVGGLGMMYREQASLIDQSAKFADRLGLTTEALSEMQYAAQLNGVTGLEMALQRMTRRVAEAANGTGEAVAALDELGISAQDLAALSPDQQLAVIADAMQDVTSQSDRVRLAFKLFDSEGVSMVNMLRLGSAGMGELAQEARDLGYSLDRDAAAAIERANDNLTRLGAAVTGVKREMSVGLAGAINSLADNAELLSEIFGITLAVAIGRATAAMGTYGAGKIKKIAAERADIAATIAQAKAEERRALVMKASALTTVQAQAADARLAAARGTLAAMTDKATLSARAYNGVMALTGGPAGMVMMAVGALGYWIATSGDADKANKDLAGSTDLLNKKLSELTDKQLAVAQLNARDAIRDLEQQIKETTDRINDTQTTITVSSYTTGGDPVEVVNQQGLDNVVRLNADMEALNSKLATQKERLEDINTLMGGGAVPDKPEDKGSNSGQSGGNDAQKNAQRMLENLQKQTALYGQTTQAAQVLYEIERGGLKGVNDALQKQLLAEAKKLDQFNAQKEAAEAAAQAEQQLADMRRKTALGENATEVQKAQYEIDNGDLGGVDSELQQQILEAAADLDQQKARQKADAFEQEVEAIELQTLRRLELQAAGEEAAKVQAQYEHEDRLATLAERFEEVHEAATGNQELQQQLEDQYFSAREGLWQQHQVRLTEIEKDQAEKRRQMQMQQLQNYSSLFGSMADVVGTFAGEQSGAYKAMFAVSKAFSIAESIMAIQTGIAKAWELGFPLGIPAAATVVANTASIISTISGTQFQGQAHDGINRVPAQNEGTWMLRKDEMVLNPEQADNFRWMASYMQQMESSTRGMAGGFGGGAVPMLIRFEGLPEGFTASQRMEDGQIVALIQAGDKQTEEKTYGRMTQDARTRSNAFGKALS